MDTNDDRMDLHLDLGATARGTWGEEGQEGQAAPLSQGPKAVQFYAEYGLLFYSHESRVLADGQVLPFCHPDRHCWFNQDMLYGRVRIRMEQDIHDPACIAEPVLLGNGEGMLLHGESQVRTARPDSILGWIYDPDERYHRSLTYEGSLRKLVTASLDNRFDSEMDAVDLSMTFPAFYLESTDSTLLTHVPEVEMFDLAHRTWRKFRRLDAGPVVFGRNFRMSREHRHFLEKALIKRVWPGQVYVGMPGTNPMGTLSDSLRAHLGRPLSFNDVFGPSAELHSFHTLAVEGALQKRMLDRHLEQLALEGVSALLGQPDFLFR